MVSHMRAVVALGQDLTTEERDLLLTACKNCIQSKQKLIDGKRASLNVLSSTEQNVDPAKLPMIQSYKTTIESELLEISSYTLEIVVAVLRAISVSKEDEVMCLKLTGDFNK